ncbi:hypothetical protein ACRCJN_11235, partial [Aerococcus urinaeequi]|uniref:hypothetical protein n=1 Tax=Aerococcus urinaeequi TaxID=51665 RepID=UPI003D6A666F
QRSGSLHAGQYHTCRRRLADPVTFYIYKITNPTLQITLKLRHFGRVLLTGISVLWSQLHTRPSL